jgi:hypothetical protein
LNLAFPIQGGIKVVKIIEITMNVMDAGCRMLASPAEALAQAG